MAKIHLAVANQELPSEFSCGVKSIDALAKEAYAKTIFKQGLAYNILYNGLPVGSCMIKFVSLMDETAEYYAHDQEFTCLELSYIAIDSRVQGHGIGTMVLSQLIAFAKEISASLPVRFFVLDALKDKEIWYTEAGFEEYPKAEDVRYPGTVPMRMELMDMEAAEEYVASCL